jgi:hypothetical protein
MKQKMTSMLTLNTKRNFAAIHGWVLAGLLACLAFSASAAVQVTRFDPPIQISAYAEPTGESFYDEFAADLDADGVVDFRLIYAYGEMSAFFNVPTRFAQRVSQPNVEAKWGPLAGVPLGSTIGSNLVSSVATNFYAWSSGYSNKFDDLTAGLGDNQTTVLIANLVTYGVMPGLIVTIDTNGFTTNTIYPHLTISGDVAFKDAVMALEFYIDGQPHYGYIHFNFSGGASGVIYGWAYETDPNVPIAATSLAPIPVDTQPAQHSGVVGLVQGVSVPGWTVSISSMNGTFVKSAPVDADGYFKVDLAPASYILQPFYPPQSGPGQPVAGDILAGMRKPVRVIRNQFSFVVLNGAPGKTPRREKP